MKRWEDWYAAHLPVDEIVDVRLRAAEIRSDLGYGEDAVTKFHPVSIRF